MPLELSRFSSLWSRPRSNHADTGFYKGKLQAARFFLTWEVPGVHHALAILEASDDTCLGMQADWF